MRLASRCYTIMTMITITLILSLCALSGEITTPTASTTPAQFPDYGLAAYLQAYGGWAIAALAIIALVYLYRDTNKQFKERHIEYVNLNTEAVKVMQSVAIAQNHMTQIIERIEKIMEQQSRIIGEQSGLLERAAKSIGNCEHANK